MVALTEQARPITVSTISRVRRLAPEHALLIAVVAGYCLLVWLRTSQSMSLTFDEVVYASQVSTDTPAAQFTAPRARGMSLLLAPVVAITEWVLAFRAYLIVVSGLLMYLAFRPWLTIFGRLGGRYRYVPALAAGFLATLWLTVLYGSLAYPNLWLGFVLVAGVGYLCRAVDEPAWGPLAGVALSFAAASLIRPTDTLAAAGPLLLAVLAVRAWRRLRPVLALLTGLLIGWGAWIAEAYARFDGPLNRLREGAETNRGGLVNSLPAHIDALDGPALLCRPHRLCEGIDPIAAGWWFLLPVLVAIGVVAASRTRWLAVALLATSSAVAVAVPYFLLIDYAAPRFLLPSYALLAIPVAGGLLWLTGLGDRTMRTLLTVAVAIGLLLHVAIQQDVLGPVADRLESGSRTHAQFAESLRDHGVQQPCLVWGENAVQLSYLLKCRSVLEQGGDAPSEADPYIVVALARGDYVVVRVSTAATPPESMSDWERVQLPGDRRYVVYLSPG